ncbi:MAG: asparaginase domain-containing protein [Acidobacteriota bacterium]
MSSTRQITLITTGGTIEKIYDESSGELSNRQSLVRRMLGELRLEDASITVLELMSKDSLEMTERDRKRIAAAVRLAGAADPDTGCDGVVILHGTDTLTDTGEALLADLSEELKVPVILTGAMRPFEMKRSDALQNLTESIFAAGVLPRGVYCVAHGQSLSFPGVRKDRDRGTFVSTRATEETEETSDE